MRSLLQEVSKRIGSIETHARGSNVNYNSYWKRVYQYGIAFILPLYVLMQPLFVPAGEPEPVKKVF